VTWWRAVLAAGAVPAAFTPEVAAPRESKENDAGTELVEDAELRAHALPLREQATIPPIVSFLNGSERWRVVAYDGIAPIVEAWVAAAVRRRDARGELRTTHQRARTFVVAPVTRLSAAVRRDLEHAAPEIEPLDAEVAQPVKYLEQVEALVRRVRAALEREVADAAVTRLAADEWLVLDGLLSRSPAVARHPRALGVIKSHGAQFLQGRGLERALTLPAGNRTSVFAVRGGHTRLEVYSWYLRLWPWEGNDLLYGLLRVEACAGPETIARATALSGWLWAERAPLATPATRWDRLLYPLHNVEEYLKALPRTGT
jgi:hypothetical protein